MLEELRTRVTTEEVGLDEVLEGDKNIRKRFPDADRLLGEVSRKVLEFPPLQLCKQNIFISVFKLYIIKCPLLNS